MTRVWRWLREHLLRGERRLAGWDDHDDDEPDPLMDSAW